MVLGLSLATYTLIHVIISLAGIVSGLVVMCGLLTANPMKGWTALFLITTVLTSVTGFGFPFMGVTPAIILGVLSLIVLAAAIVARYPLGMAGIWRKVYVISASVALYFNVFVLVVQSFEKVPALKAAAPTQKEAPFAITQLAVLAFFAVVTTLAVRRSRGMPIETAKVAGKAA
jgi:hypothetical protein